MTMVETPIVVAMTWVLVEEVDPVMAHRNTGVILTCISCSLIMASLFKQGERLNFWLRLCYFGLKANTVFQLLISSLLLFSFFSSNMCPFC